MGPGRGVVSTRLRRLAAAVGSAPLVIAAQAGAARAGSAAPQQPAGGAASSGGSAPSALSWIPIEDSRGISVWKYEMSLDRGGVTSPGSDISSDGTKVAFQASSDELVQGYQPLDSTAFVRDLAAGTTVVASAGPGGAALPGSSSDPQLSADGSTVVFRSFAHLAGPPTREMQIYHHVLATGVTTRVATGEGSRRDQAVSGDGAFVIFTSDSDDLSDDDPFGDEDVYVFEVGSGQVSLISQASPSAPPHRPKPSHDGVVSDDGSTVVFTSREQLVGGLGGEPRDVAYAYDVATGTVSLASHLKDDGFVVGGVAHDVSSDGRRVLYLAAPDVDSRDTYLYLEKVRTRRSAPDG